MKKHCCENVFEAIGFPPDEAAALKVRADITLALGCAEKKKEKAAGNCRRAGAGKLPRMGKRAAV